MAEEAYSVRGTSALQDGPALPGLVCHFGRVLKCPGVVFSEAEAFAVARDFALENDRLRMVLAKSFEGMLVGRSPEVNFHDETALIPVDPDQAKLGDDPRPIVKFGEFTIRFAGTGGFSNRRYSLRLRPSATVCRREMHAEEKLRDSKIWLRCYLSVAGERHTADLLTLEDHEIRGLGEVLTTASSAALEVFLGEYRSTLCAWLSKERSDQRALAAKDCNSAYDLAIFFAGMTDRASLGDLATSVRHLDDYSATARAIGEPGRESLAAIARTIHAAFPAPTTVHESLSIAPQSWLRVSAGAMVGLARLARSDRALWIAGVCPHEEDADSALFPESPLHSEVGRWASQLLPRSLVSMFAQKF